jgi:hypothetical protein
MWEAVASIPLSYCSSDGYSCCWPSHLLARFTLTGHLYQLQLLSSYLCLFISSVAYSPDILTENRKWRFVQLPGVYSTVYTHTHIPAWDNKPGHPCLHPKRMPALLTGGRGQCEGSHCENGLLHSLNFIYGCVCVYKLMEAGVRKAVRAYVHKMKLVPLLVQCKSSLKVSLHKPTAP